MIKKCIELATKLTGKKPQGWRAPLYQIREHTIRVLEEEGFLYGMSYFQLYFRSLLSNLDAHPRLIIYLLQTPFYLIKRALQAKPTYRYVQHFPILLPDLLYQATITDISNTDTSLTHHDSQPYFLPLTPPIKPIDFSPSLPASSWMVPLPATPAPTSTTLVELPANWYMEDMTPMQFLPSAPNSHGCKSLSPHLHFFHLHLHPQHKQKHIFDLTQPDVPTSSILSMWQARFQYLYSEMQDSDRESKDGFLFPLVLHPDTSGMAHVIGMIDAMIAWLKAQGGLGEVEFWTYGDAAGEWRGRQEV